MLTPRTLPALQRLIADAGLDGWLLFDFHGANPIAGALLGLEGLVSRRVFAFVPREGAPVAITHAIEQGPWRDWPAEWGKRVYSGWRALESELASLVAGKRVAMEYSPGDAVPYIDRVPAGVLEMVRAAGATVESSGELVSRFYAVWTPEHLAAHRRAAEAIAGVARAAAADAVRAADAGTPLTEREVQQRIVAEFDRLGLEADHPPIVAWGPNAADPHYAPAAEGSAPVVRGRLLLIDLWAREPGQPFADQTWMFSLGTPSAREVEVWEAVRDAREAAVALLRERIAAGAPVLGGEVDDAARAVIAGRGLGEYFVHRTGHSIDPRDLHGSGPHIDNLESREERVLVPGVAFSIEPGVYVRGEVGARSEVNAFIGDGELVVTPSDMPRDLIVL
jgi:Xaa-Pro aminopeptidase